MNERKVTERCLSRTEFTDSESSSLPTSEEPRRIVILIPGIRTNADWIDQAAQSLETFSRPIKAYKAYGGLISAFHLLSRIGVRGIKDDICNQIISILLQHPNSEVSLVCHSMGTDIVADLLIKRIDYKFKYIIFLVSICSRRKAMAIKKSCQYFINHRGTYDPWPILASIARPFSYDYTGVFGFNSGAWVNEATFNNDHASCTSMHHVMEFVVPTIMGLEVLNPSEVSYNFDINNYYYVRFASYALLIFGIVGEAFNRYSVVLSLLGCILPIVFYKFRQRVDNRLAPTKIVPSGDAVGGSTEQPGNVPRGPDKLP